MSAIWSAFTKGTGRLTKSIIHFSNWLSYFTSTFHPHHPHPRHHPQHHPHHHEYHIAGEESGKATCNTCLRKLSVPGGTTSSLVNHLKSRHTEKYQEILGANAASKAKANPVWNPFKTAEKRPASEPGGSRPPKQVRLEDCIPDHVQDLNKQIDDAVVDLLAHSGIAFRVVGLPAFEKLLKVANKRVTLKHRTTYSRMVKVKAAEIKKEIMDVINTVKGDLSCAAFTTDMWTSGAGDPFMSLTIHFIDKHWRLHRWTPYIAPFPASHSGMNISIGLDAMIMELGVDGGQWELFSVKQVGKDA